MKLIDEIHQFVLDPNYGVKFLWVPADEYINFLKNSSKYLTSDIAILGYKFETEFEESCVCDLLKKYDIDINTLNHKIINHLLSEKELIKELFPKTKFQVNLFILLQTYNFVILPLAGFTPDVIEKLVRKWKEVYPSKKILAIDSSISYEKPFFHLK